MAERIHSVTRIRPGRAPRYPWDTWTDGSAWRIRHGEDFDVSAENMGRLVREYARRNGKPVKAAVNTEAGTVEFQFDPHEAVA